MTERIAVIIPCFNDGPLLAETIASIDEREPLDLVVVDDGSTDSKTVDTVDRLEADGVRVVRHEVNRGLVYARATGLDVTTAPFVFPLDSDDLAVPGAFGRMADRLDGVPEAVVCYGDYEEFGTHELIRAVPSTIDPYRVAYANEYPVSALFRRSVFDEASAWKLPQRGYEDWSLWMAIAERGLPGVYLGPGEPTFRKRFHGERMLHQAKREHRGSTASCARFTPGCSPRSRAPAALGFAGSPEAPVPDRLRGPAAVRRRTARQGLARPDGRVDADPMTHAVPVAFVSSHAGRGGSERYLGLLLEHLPRDWVATVVCLQDGPFAGDLGDRGFSVEVIETGRGATDLTRAARRLRGVFKRSAPAVVHANGLKAALVAELAAFGGQPPVIWFKHDVARDGWLAASPPPGSTRDRRALRCDRGRRRLGSGEDRGSSLPDPGSSGGRGGRAGPRARGVRARGAGARRRARRPSRPLQGPS